MPLTRILGVSLLRGRKTPGYYLWFLAIRDWILILFLGRSRRISLENLRKRRIVVSKIDHLGDLLMISPFLLEIKRQLQQVEIILVTGSWNEPVAQMLREGGMCDVVCHYDAPALNRSTSGYFRRLGRFIRSFLITRSQLLRERPDIFVDLRPFSPNTLLLARLCRIPFRVGFGLRGLSFTLQRVIPYDEKISVGQLYLNALPLLGLRGARYEKPFLGMQRGRDSRTPVSGARAEPYILFQPTSGEISREIPSEIWDQILDVLCSHFKVLAVGSAADQPRIDRFAHGRQRRVFESVAGRTNIREALEYAKGSAGCIGVDSLFAHVGIAFDLPVCVLGVRGISQRASYPEDNPNLFFVNVDSEDFSAWKVGSEFVQRVVAHRVDIRT